MDRFIHAEVSFAQAGGRQHADGAGDLAGFVRENVAENVAGDDDVKLLRPSDQLHGRIIHIEVIQLHFRVVLCNLGYRLSPQTGAVQHVGLVHAGDFFATLHGHIEGHFCDAPDFHFGIFLDIPGDRAFFRSAGFGASLPEVDSPGEFSNDDDVQTAVDDFRFQRRSVCQLVEDHGRSQVGEEPQLFSQAEQGAFRTFTTRHAVPFRAAYSAQHDRIAGFAYIQRLLRQAGAGGIDGRTACENRGIVEVMSVFFTHFVQHLQGLGHDFRTDAVAGDYCNFKIHSIFCSFKFVF